MGLRGKCLLLAVEPQFGLILAVFRLGRGLPQTLEAWAGLDWPVESPPFLVSGSALEERMAFFLFLAVCSFSALMPLACSWGSPVTSWLIHPKPGSC